MFMGSNAGPGFVMVRAPAQRVRSAPAPRRPTSPVLECRQSSAKAIRPMSHKTRTVPLGIVLVEDDAPTCAYLVEKLSKAPDLTILATAGSLAEARAALARHAPNVLITDLQLPDGHGVDLIREVRGRLPATDIMVISVLGDEQTVMAALRAGASGYILKDAPAIDLIAAVRDLVEGRSPISAAIARHIIRLVQAGGSNGGPDVGLPVPAALTAREIDVLWGIAKGFTYKDIADRLGISRHTVPTHIKNIYRKLEVNSRSEAVFEAVQRRLIKMTD